MRDSVERYFELLPVLLIALIMLAREYTRFEPLAMEWSEIPRVQKSVSTGPRLIFR